MNNKNEELFVIECPDCGQKVKHVMMDALDSNEHAYYKQRLFNGTLFEFKCEKCGYKMDLANNMVYRDSKHNVLIYMVNGDEADGVYTALRLTDALTGNNEDYELQKMRKRIVTCPHQLREKVLIFDNGIDDRVIELVKFFCIENAKENIPDFYPIGAAFNVKNGKFVIDLVGEDGTITAMIPDGFCELLEHDFADVLEEDDEYVINDLWAMDVLGIESEDEMEYDNI